MSIGPMILYVHIPKAAGTSAASMFYEQYKERLGVIDMNDWESWQHVLRVLPFQYECLFGHFFYGLHNDMPRTCEYTSVMRNPVDAILSYHSYIVRRADHPFHQWMGNGSLKQFLKLPSELMYAFRNYQTTMLTGKLNATAEEAIEIIERNYPILGTVERFEETVYLWQERFGWGEVKMFRENGGDDIRKNDKLSWADLRGIEELVDVDLEVYSYVRSRLAKRILTLSSEAKASIRSFKQTGVLDPASL